MERNSLFNLLLKEQIHFD